VGEGLRRAIAAAKVTQGAKVHFAAHRGEPALCGQSEKTFPYKDYRNGEITCRKCLAKIKRILAATERISKECMK
jgi:hypothetical protein